MEKIIQFLTNSQDDAYKVVDTLKQLDNADDIQLSEVYVLVKNDQGEVSLKNAQGQDTDATLFGAFIGGFIGLMGGPIGFLLGSSLGMLTGSVFDLDKAVDAKTYLNAATEKIPNGKCLVVAHVYEDWETPIDSKLGSIAQITRVDVDEAAAKAAQKEIDDLNAKIDDAEAKLKNSIESDRADLQAKLDEMKAQREQKFAELKGRYETQRTAYKKWFEDMKQKIKSKL